MSTLDTDDLVLAVADACDGVMRGRTLLQKLGYFVSEVMQLDAQYRAHYYGPYSEAMTASLQGQVSRGLLQETIETFDDYGFSGHDFPRRRYTYALTDAGRAALAWRRKNAEDAFRKAASILSKITTTTPDYRVLSYAAKLYFLLLQSGGPMSLAAALERASEDYGWPMTPEQMQAGARMLADVGLVQAEAKS